MMQIEIDVEDLAKAKKRIWVKATSTRKGHYREQKVGEKGELLFPPPRKLSGKEIESFVGKNPYEKPEQSEESHGTKVFVTPENMKKGMIINKENSRILFEIVKVSRVNVHVLPYPSLPDIDEPKMVKKTDLSSYIVHRNE